MPMYLPRPKELLKDLFKDSISNVYKVWSFLKSMKFKKIAWIPFTFSENSNYWRESLLELIQKFVDNARQCFALLPEVNFPSNNLNFH